MAKILDMPKLSPTMEEGRLATWHKKEGDPVGIDDLLAEVETDKATMEFRSFDKGVLLKQLVAPGATVVLGQPVAILGEAGEDVSALVAQASGGGAGKKEGASGAGASPTPAAGPVAATGLDAPKPAPAPAKDDPGRAPPPPSPEVASPPPASPAPDARGTDGRVRASPLVRRMAREEGVDLRSLRGSGPRGRIVQRDLETANARPAAATPAADARGVPPPPSTPPAGPAPAPPRAPRGKGELAPPESIPLSMMRKTIARRLTESKQTVPHFYLTVDLDADALVALREEINHELAEGIDGGAAGAGGAGREKPAKISINDMMIRACAVALRRVPRCNAQFTPEAILVHSRVDVSVAVAVDDGLVTPVVRDADIKTLRAISSEVRELAGRAKTKKLRPEEMTAGTFSISNLGMYGIDAFAAVINPPEGAILAVGQVRREPVVKGDQIVIGHRLACTLSCDHRVVDGAIGATFLKELRRLVERPMQFLV